LRAGAWGQLITRARGQVPMPSDSRANAYLARAQDLRHMAAIARTVDVRTELLYLADQYEKLADLTNKIWREQ
jgi:hypothetical protein